MHTLFFSLPPAAGVIFINSMQSEVGAAGADMRIKTSDYRILFRVHGLLLLPPFVKRVLERGRSAGLLAQGQIQGKSQWQGRATK